MAVTHVRFFVCCRYCKIGYHLCWRGKWIISSHERLFLLLSLTFVLLPFPENNDSARVTIKIRVNLLIWKSIYHYFYFIITGFLEHWVYCYNDSLHRKTALLFKLHVNFCCICCSFWYKISKVHLHHFRPIDSKGMTKSWNDPCRSPPMCLPMPHIVAGKGRLNIKSHFAVP